MFLEQEPAEAISSARSGEVGSSSDPGGNRPWKPAHFSTAYSTTGTANRRAHRTAVAAVVLHAVRPKALPEAPFGAQLVAPGQNLLVTARKVILSLVSRRRPDNVRTKFQSRS